MNQDETKRQNRKRNQEELRGTKRIGMIRCPRMHRGLSLTFKQIFWSR